MLKFIVNLFIHTNVIKLVEGGLILEKQAKKATLKHLMSTWVLSCPEVYIGYKVYM